MKKINEIQVKMKFTVNICDEKVSEKTYNELKYICENCGYWFTGVCKLLSTADELQHTPPDDYCINGYSRKKQGQFIADWEKK